MATHITEISIVRADGEDAVIRMTTPEGSSGQVVLDEESQEYDMFCDAVETIWDLIISHQ